MVTGCVSVLLGFGCFADSPVCNDMQSRIKEQDAEKIALRRQQQELRKEHQQLLRDKKTKEARITELDKRAYNVQMLKFGQEIDLELLDRIGTTRGAEELQEQLKAQEAGLAKELKQWDHKIQEAQDQMMALTIENTQCLQVGPGHAQFHLLARLSLRLTWCICLVLCM